MGADACGVENAGGRAAGAVGDVAGGLYAGDGVDGGRAETPRAWEGGRRRAPETSERDESRGGRGAEGRLANFYHLIFYLRTF